MDRKKLFAIATFLGMCGTAAQAQDHKFYLGLDVGQAYLDDDALPDVGLDTDNDDTSTTYAVKFGYRFNRYFSLEGGYTDLGDFSSRGPVACIAQVGVPCDPISLDLSMQGIMVNAVGTWPVSEHIVLSASAGVIYRELDTRYTDPAGNRSSNSDEDSVTKFGVGVAFPINERFEVGLDFTAYRDVGVGIASSNSSTDFYAVNDGEANVFSLGLRWRF